MTKSSGVSEPSKTRFGATIIVLANSMIYQNQASGGDKVFVELSKYLNREGFRILVITTSAGVKLWGTVPGVRPMLLPSYRFEESLGHSGVPIVYLLRSLLSVNYTYKQAGGRNQPLLYSSSDFLPDVLAPFLLKTFGTKVVWVSRSYHIIPSPSRRRGNKAMNLVSFVSQRIALLMMRKQSDLIIALNESLRKELEALGMPPSRLAVSGVGIDTECADSIRPDEREIYDGIFLGRIHPSKGVFDLLEIWSLVISKKEDAKLAIVGGGERETVQMVRNKIRELSLEQNVDYLGYVENDIDVYRLLKRSRLFLMTDHEAGWSLATCEAMACQVPVVAYNLQIFGTVFKKGFVSVPIYDTERFAKTVLHLLANEQERLRIGQAGRMQAEQFSWERVADDFSTLLAPFKARVG